MTQEKFAGPVLVLILACTITACSSTSPQTQSQAGDGGTTTHARQTFLAEPAAMTSFRYPSAIMRW